jgi:hypothetical protein
LQRPAGVLHVVLAEERRAAGQIGEAIRAGLLPPGVRLLTLVVAHPSVATKALSTSAQPLVRRNISTPGRKNPRFIMGSPYQQRVCHAGQISVISEL